jgi:GNAT superfamily N-acetyltransferase
MDARSIDPASSRDIEESLQLFKLVYGRTMSERFYRWRFIDNPFGPPMVSLLWDGETLAGHYSVSPTRAMVDSQPQLAAQSMTTMTHPSYRNRGVFTILAEHLYDRMADLGARMVWGLPNTQSHYGFTQKLKWKDVGLIATMTQLVGPGERGGSIDEGRTNGPAVTDLFERSVDGRIFPSIKDEAYIRWRYVDHPEQQYRLFGLPSSDDVLFVTKDYETPQGMALEVVDYLYARQPPLFSAAMRGLLDWARERRYAMVRTWMSMADPAFLHLEKLGFAPREPIAYFGGRALGAFELPADSWSERRWCVTMGNSDNY